MGFEVSKNLEDLRKRIIAACERSRRDPAEIHLIGVAKGQPVERIREAVEAGLSEIGENYAKEMMEHAGAGSPLPIQWHFIGHLQRNKVKQIIGQTALIHSVDSLALATEINRQAEAHSKVQPILIEINLAGETSKGGIVIGSPDLSPLTSLIEGIGRMKNLSLQGLMTLPPAFSDPDAVRPFFQRLREIRDEINGERMYSTRLTQLSMGMTSDFEVALEEGATLIRIGTGLFGKRGSS